VSFDGFTARAKAGSNPFNPQGVHVGIVRRRDIASQTVWVELPRVAEGFEFGPVRVSSTVLPLVGQSVSCVFVEDVTDDIIVLGAVREPSSPPVAADTADRLSVARTIALGDYLAGSASFDGSANITINATPSATMDARYFNASNLASGTVPSARVAGAYTGITGLGTLNQTLNIGIAGATPAVNLTMTHPDQAAIVVGASADPTSNRASIFLGGWLFGRDSVLDGRNDFFFYDGTATRLAISSTGVISGDGGGLTNLNATNLASGTVASARIAGAYTGITSVGTLGSLAVTAGVTAASFTGDGSALTALNATQLTTGTVPTGRMTGAYTGITSIANLTTTAVNEVQTLSITGSPTGGTFTIYVMNQPLVIAYNASAATIQTNVQALAGVGSGNITCTGGNLPGTPVVFTFAGALAGTNVMPIEIGLNSLTGGTSPTPVIAQTTAGVGAVGSTSISASATVSGLSGIFDSVYTDRIYVSNTGTASPIIIQSNQAGASGLQINASTHATSRRAGISLGGWVMGQDLLATGGLDFFIWNGTPRIRIEAGGLIRVGNSAESMRFVGDNSYVSFYEGTDVTRRGYVQGISTGMNVVADGANLDMYANSQLFRLASGSVTLINQVRLGTWQADGSYTGLTDRASGAANNYVIMANTSDTLISSPGAAGTIKIRPANNGTVGEAIFSTTRADFEQQVRSLRNGGSSGSGATTNDYYNASFYAGPADKWGASTASIAFHSSGVAPQLRVGTSDAQIYNRDFVGTGNNPFTASAFNVASTKRIKKNITEWPMRAAGAASPSALSQITKLRVVTFERDEPSIHKEVPSGRRGEAYRRLQEYAARTGKPAYELPDHDCSVHGCNGTADEPCARHLNQRRPEYGLIAEEVHEVFPEAVNYDADKLPNSINYSMIDAIVIAAIKELAEELAALKEGK